MTIAAGRRLGPYEIVAPLGAGSMGEVYRARDPRLGREVAIKVLPAAFAEDPDRLRRFEQEARAASALNHPNILTIYDLGTHEAGPYVVSELLEGETLREHLAAGPLPPSRSVALASELAHGLAAAHDKGIVHRDIKPENLFVTRDGRLKILDFGLARREAAPQSSSLAPTLEGTEPGTLLGTVAYMSPEQVRGKPADARSDLFSAGVVLYEMLAGRRPFAGDSHVETMTAILRDEPAPLQAVAPALDRLLRRCLEKEIEHRFQHARDLAFALESLSSETPQAAMSDATAGEHPRSVAVLLFEDLARDPANAHVGLGLADATITELASVKSLLVRPTASVLRFRERPAEPEAAGRELGVDAVVYGSFQRSGSRLRVTVQLVRTADGRSLWGTKIDTSARRRLPDAGRRLAPDRRGARGRTRAAGSPEPPGRREGIGEGARALPSRPVPPFHRHDPCERQCGHRELRAGAGDRPGLRARPARPCRRLHPHGLQHRSGRRLVRARRGDVPPRARPRARPARGPLPARAAALEPAQRLGRDGCDARVHRGDRGAPTSTRRITPSHRSSITSGSWRKPSPRSIGRSRSTPRTSTPGCTGRSHGTCRDAFDEALAATERHLAQNPTPWGLYQAAMCQLHLERPDDAAATAERLARQFTGNVLLFSLRGLLAAREGKTAKAREQIDLVVRNRKLFGHYHHAQYDVACIETLLGERDAALDWLVEAARNGFPCAPFLEADPWLEPIRAQPRYRRLLDELEANARERRRLSGRLLTRGRISSRPSAGRRWRGPAPLPAAAGTRPAAAPHDPRPCRGRAAAGAGPCRCRRPASRRASAAARRAARRRPPGRAAGATRRRRRSPARSAACPSAPPSSSS